MQLAISLPSSSSVQFSSFICFDDTLFIMSIIKLYTDVVPYLCLYNYDYVSCFMPIRPVLLPLFFYNCVTMLQILATRDTQFGQELALVMQTTHAQRMRRADSIPMC